MMLKYFKTTLLIKAPADFADFADDSEKTIGCLYKKFFIDLKTAI